MIKIKKDQVFHSRYVPIVAQTELHCGVEIMKAPLYVMLVDFSKLYIKLFVHCMYTNKKNSLKLHNEKRPLSMKTNVIKKRQRAETLIASSSDLDEESVKKPRYYDQQSLYASDNHATPGYRNTVSTLPGTGILMMTPSSTTSSHS